MQKSVKVDYFVCDKCEKQLCKASEVTQFVTLQNQCDINHWRMWAKNKNKSVIACPDCQLAVMSEWAEKLSS